jgi:hypothetical protein
VPYWCQDVKLLKAHWHQCSIEAMSYSYLSPETLLPTDLVNHKSISQEPCFAKVALLAKQARAL